MGMKSFFRSLLLWWIVFFPALSFAASSPDAFQIEVSPSTFQVNQAVDFTVTALKANAVMKDADFNFFIYVASEGGEDISYVDYVVPNDGFSNFVASDQGVKKFSKGLLLRKPGTYQLKIVDFQNEEIAGSTIIIVNADVDRESYPISIVSPLAGSKESISPVEVIARSEKLPNTRVQLFLNNKMMEELIASPDGTITTSLTALNTGNNVLQIKAFASDNQEIWSSEIITFDYTPLWEKLFSTLTMTPNQNLKLWDRVRFELGVDERVSSAKMIFSSGKEYPMDKQKEGIFEKELVLLNTGTILVDLQLIVMEEAKNYLEVLAFEVKDHLKIWEVKLQATGSSYSAIDLSWKVLDGEAEQFAVFYGTGADQLSGTILTTEPYLALTGLTHGKRYYFQIQALDQNHESEGLPSDIVEFDLPILTGVGPEGNPITGHAIVTDPLCMVKNINFSTKKIGSRYYMLRDAVEHAEKYRIFRAETPESTKRLIGETEIARFEYPFDTTVTGEQFAYYSIEAVCKDGSKAMLANAEKVQVGPMEDFLLILSATLLFFFAYRFYSYNIR